MQKTYATDKGKRSINRGQKAKYYVENSHPPIVSRSDWKRLSLFGKVGKQKYILFQINFVVSIVVQAL